MADPVSHTILQLRDIAEQRDSNWIALLPGTDSSPIALDDWEIADAVLYGYLNQRMIFAVPTHRPWALYHRSLFRTLTQEEAFHEARAQYKGIVALAKESDATPTLPTEDTLTRVPTGQYL